MATTKFKGNEVHTAGELPKVGQKAPDFVLTTVDLKDVSLKDYAGKKKIFSINPSLDTGVCQKTTVEFNRRAAELPNVAVLSVTADLPFAMKRFCTEKEVKNAQPLSMMRNRKFADDWGVRLTDGPLAGVTARAVVVLDENDVVKHVELVPEITTEPDYDAALKAAT
jgi:thiol peroxidase